MRLRAGLVVFFACSPLHEELPTSPEEGKKVRVVASALRPARPKDWYPHTAERVMYKRPETGAWELFDVLRDPPTHKGKLRELWQPKRESIEGSVGVEEVYPYPRADERPRLEANAYAACLVIDAKFPNNRGTRLCRVDSRVRDNLHVIDEDGRKLRLHASDCIKLQ